MKQFVLIDDYTLAIAHDDSGVIFSGCHSRQAISGYDDSILIQFLAQKALDESFWHCLQAREVYQEADGRFHVMNCQQILSEKTWMLPEPYRNWPVWELIEHQTQIHGQSFNDPICLWYPGSYFRMFCIPYRTALKIIEVARDWIELQQIRRAGIEVLNEAEWTARFAASGRPAQFWQSPRILSDLERMAGTYVLFFEEDARLYTPTEVEFIRAELLQHMSIVNFLNRKISAEILDRLFPYPNLHRCVVQAEKLWHYLDCTRLSISQGKAGLTLDWMFFDPGYPESDSQFHKLCLQHVQNAQLKHPYTIPFELDGRQYRLVTGRMYYNTIVLVNVLEIRQPTDAIALFSNVEQPTYLELITWAALKRISPPIAAWEQVVDWRGREDELATLGTDPTLPQADFFLNCLSSHLATLWQNGDEAALKKGLRNLQCHYSQAAHFLYRRGEMLRSGTLKFRYADWFEDGVLQLYQAEQQNS